MSLLAALRAEINGQTRRFDREQVKRDEEIKILIENLSDVKIKQAVSESQIETLKSR